MTTSRRQKPRIVVLDGAALNPGDLSWDRLERLGDCEIHERTALDRIEATLGDADAVLTNKAPISRRAIESLPRLKYIGVTATGYNIVDVAAAKEHGVRVTNVPSYGTAAVAQMVFAHLLHLCNNVAGHAAAVRDGKWSRAPDWCFWLTPQIELSGMTIGIIGLGEIGRAVAQIARSFNMHVIAAKSSRGDISHSEVIRVDLDEVFRLSDVVSLHCPLTPETNQLVGRERLKLMKPTAFLINTSRGQLVDEAALSEALATRAIAGAGLDVLAVEPPVADNPLMSVNNCFITPHIAWATLAARRRLLDTAVDNLAAFLEGRATNVVT